ncbi:hypothetical protein HDV00_004914 [Rhizophlyctis rosea]|nr:hypothetical protein HDV00_004914 [Rhizophlyctis rosea]
MPTPPALVDLQTLLQRTLDLLLLSRPRAALELLGNVTDAVVENVETLGLADIDFSSEAANLLALRYPPGTRARNEPERKEFWAGLNDTWLFVVRHAASVDGGDLREDDPSAERLTDDDWCSTLESLVSWGNILAWYGLVDYEVGFWEEEIVVAVEERRVKKEDGKKPRAPRVKKAKVEGEAKPKAKGRASKGKEVKEDFEDKDVDMD